MARTLVASDWHLGPKSPPVARRLALAFLERARAGGDRVILNGDIFENLFLPPGRAEAALPDVAAAIAALAAEGLLLRTCGNHDPAAGPPSLELSVPGVGRVLVAHGHGADPINASPVGRLGDAISRRFGTLALVRGAAAAAEHAARLVAGDRMERVFRTRCAALVAREGFDLGVFGHVHARHLAPGDRYANSGWLSARGLEYLVVGAEGLRLEVIGAGEVR